MNAHAAAEYHVRNGRNRYHLIPYIGNKSGFSHIFDDLVPDRADGMEIVDVFGGSGAFAIYACFRFGSGRITYNDNNPVLANFMTRVRDDAAGLARLYERHRERSSPEYFLKIRSKQLADGLAGAGRFLYLAKTAFSGKIRFNQSNTFNAPMRKGSNCPALDLVRFLEIGRKISDMTITNYSYGRFADAKNAFLYLDPPYLNNTNGHYNGVPDTGDFMRFVKNITPRNHVMISEQNRPDEIGLPRSYRVYPVELRRSLQYATRRDSTEIIAINYAPDGTKARTGRLSAPGA